MSFYTFHKRDNEYNQKTAWFPLIAKYSPLEYWKGYEFNHVESKFFILITPLSYHLETCFSFSFFLYANTSSIAAFSLNINFRCYLYLKVAIFIQEPSLNNWLLPLMRFDWLSWHVNWVRKQFKLICKWKAILIDNRFW